MKRKNDDKHKINKKLKFTFPTEIIRLIIQIYEFEDLEELINIALVSKLFKELIKELFVIIFIVGESWMLYNPKPIYKYKVIRNGISHELTKKRCGNLRSIYYDWR
ncbi:5061_t:CDS:1 [Scutellospora calospora]|uniref:5061_t:CDS:1 n=1 Tax=Scutellospora calospora TaxID=85575 RepID=A0ACA9KDJ5_9GLOM|nr:5061_t:CDS:1 [Scutellospora calospora]